MFDQLKKMQELKQLQDELGKEKISVEKEGVILTMNGKMEVESVQLNLGLDKEKHEKILKEAINEAIKKIQMSMFQKMSEKGIGGF